MQELDDNALLREYVERDSEEAFATLVTRHINKVYSVALRHTRNSHQAEEITQAVFVILAKKSHYLGKGVVLSGWLYQTSRLTAVTFIRSEIRRARREQEAYMQTVLNENESDVWPQIAPLLDAAMAGLSETDRHAVVLRYFDGKSMKEIGIALGASEDAAKMRLNRAVEKLRAFFTKRGIVLPTAVLTAAISANSVQAAPAVLAKTAIAVAFAKGATASGSTLTLIKGALKVMAWTKVKTAIVVGVGVLLAAGTATVTVKEIREHQTYPWQVPQASFDVFYKAAPQVKIVPTKFSRDGQWVSDGSRGTLGIGQPVKEIVQIAYGENPLRTVFSTEMPGGKYDFIAKGSSSWAESLQAEIKRKFGVVGRHEMRETDVLLLKLKDPNVQGFKPAGSLRRTMKIANSIAVMENNGQDGKNGQFIGFDQSIGILRGFLEQYLQTPVINQTSLTNKNFDFALNWNEPNGQRSNPDGLKQALLDQLGLELVPSREPIEILVVEKVK